jgi:hypothetical protein
MRDCPFSIVYFSLYGIFRRKLADEQGKISSQVSLSLSLSLSVSLVPSLTHSISLTHSHSLVSYYHYVYVVLVLYMRSRTAICVLILLCICPQTAIYVGEQGALVCSTAAGLVAARSSYSLHTAFMQP